MMREGLLWYDGDSGRDLREKVARAVGYYARKFGEQPNRCYVHPSILDGVAQPPCIDGVSVAASSYVQRHHFFVGREDEPAAPRHTRAVRKA